MHGFRFGTVSEDDILTTNKTAVSANLNAKKTGKFGLSYLINNGQKNIFLDEFATNSGTALDKSQKHYLQTYTKLLQQERSYSGV